MHPRRLTSPFVEPVFGLRAASVPQFRRSRGHCFQQQTSHPHEIEGRRSERIDPLYALDAAVAETLDDVDEAWHGEIADRDPSLYSIIDAAGLAHGASMKSYLIMMAVRLLEMRRVLKPSGSIYLHCDPTASHYLKTLMDAVFGKKHFLNEVIWHYKSFHGNVKKYFPKKHDVLFVYKKSDIWTFNRTFNDDNTDTIDYSRWRAFLADGRNILGKNMPDHDTRFQRFLRRWVRENGRQPGPNDIVYEVKGQTYDTVWDIKPIDPKDKTERVGYPTQKPLELLDRIISASSNPGDMVLDPFCGCATALVAAETLGRRWAGIDLSPLAVRLVGQRLRDQHGFFGQITARDDVPKRTDLGELPNYRTHRHTLYGRQEGICNGCLVLFPFRNLTVDHIVPQSKGGSDHPDNLQLLCGACNSKKGERTMEALIADLLAAQIRLDTPYRRTR